MKTSYLEDISLFYYLLLYGNMPQILWGKVLTKLSKQNFFLLFRLHLVNMLLLFFSNKISQHQFFARKLSLVWDGSSHDVFAIQNLYIFAYYLLQKNSEHFLNLILVKSYLRKIRNF